MTLRLIGSYLRSDWFASGQILQRAVTEGLLDRFGAIDDSEGGNTQRLNLNGIFQWKPTEDQFVQLQTYASYYTLDLFSNFTFFLVDPVNGDGIQQVDRRWYGGVDARYERQDTLFDVRTVSTAGLQYRIDGPRVTLALHADRKRLAITQDVDILEQSVSPWVRFDLAPHPLPWLRLVTGARGDVFFYDVRDVLEGANGSLSGTATRAIPSVKANLILGPWLGTELFANYGTGFHSNDARAVILDPRLDALARARGYEFGVRSRPHPRVQLSAKMWFLDLDSELVFVGDEGTTEPRGASHRVGGEFWLGIRLFDWLSFNGNVTVTRSTFDNGDAVPLAPRTTAYADLTARWPWGLSASLSMNYVGPRFLTEDRSVVGSGYTVVNFVARYHYKAIEAFLNLQNLFNQQYEETQFYYTSRLRNEPPQGVADIHFTPGSPFSVLGGLAVRF
jgi:Outer membrane protein beta-barrel family